MTEAWDTAAREANRALLRRSGIALAVVAVLLVIGAAIGAGARGALGAVFGVALVALFFGLDVVVFRRPGAGARTAVGVVMLYVGKLVIFGFLILAVQALVDFDHRSFVVAVIIETAVAAVAALLVFTRMKVPYVQP